MGVPISVTPDDAVRIELKAQARSQGVWLATLLRNLATQAARDAKRARIREDSARVAAYVAQSPEAKAFYEFWGTRTSIIPD